MHSSFSKEPIYLSFDFDEFIIKLIYSIIVSQGDNLQISNLDTESHI